MLSAFSKIMKSYNKMLQETFRTGSILGFYQRLTQHNWILCSWQLPCDYNRGDIVFPVLPTSFTAPPALNIPAENAGVMGESKAHASGFGIALEEILGGKQTWMEIYSVYFLSKRKTYLLKPCVRSEKIKSKREQLVCSYSRAKTQLIRVKSQ